jgi:spore coat polysaccharide biosynthesis protein SpsF
MMRVGAIIQARFSSQRLPGKVLRPLCGKPLLSHLVGRMRRCTVLDLICVATSSEPSDDAVAEFCAQTEIACHRGPLDDVLARFHGATRRFKLDGIVRLSGDSPLLDPALVNQAVKLFRRGDWDLVTNVQIRSFPKGQSVEVVSAGALARAADKARAAADREHVTPFLYAHPELFRIRNLVARVARPTLQLSIDTAEDFARIEAILTAAGARADRLDLEEVAELAESLAIETVV